MTIYVVVKEYRNNTVEIIDAYTDEDVAIGKCEGLMGKFLIYPEDYYYTWKVIDVR